MDTGTTPSSCEAKLPAELESVVAARRLVAAAAESWGVADSVSQDAALAVSELVANAVLHAGTEIELRLSPLGRGLRIEVGDGCPRLPVVDVASPEELLANRSMTGRGLALVAATCDRWGAEPKSGGKVTWAEIGTDQRLVASAPPPAYPPSAPAPTIAAAAVADGVVAHTAVTGGGRRVHLVGVPVPVLLESIRHLADLQREVQVMAMGHAAPPEIDPVVQAGKPWITDLDSWAESNRRMAEQAAARGEETIDLEVVVPDDMAERLEGVGAWLRQAASSVARRYLLTLPPSAEVRAYRRWFSEEILGQLSGRAPQPCPLRIQAEV